MKKKTTSNDFEIENFTKSKAKFRFFFLTEKRKDTDIKTLRRLTIIVTVLTKSYFSTNDIAESIDESNKAKRRALNTNQRNSHEIVEISKSLISCEKISFSLQKKRQQRF